VVSTGRCLERMTLKCRDVRNAKSEISSKQCVWVGNFTYVGKHYTIARCCVDSSCSVCARVINSIVPDGCAVLADTPYRPMTAM